nr:NADH dehydrogenase subunit 7 [Helleborus torquatus]WIW41719.1 NADH dehydrogenase subunit 7 [Helleborus torquatus]
MLFFWNELKEWALLVERKQ